MPTYLIKRFFQKDIGAQVVERGLTLEEVKEHCNGPEASSKTASFEKRNEVGADKEPWFEGWEEE